jgi:hypothetical protein
VKKNAFQLNWGTGIAIVYGVFAVATTGFAVFAMDQRIDLVSDDYYERALAHDRKMQAIDHAAGLGSAFRIEQDAAANAVALTWTSARPDSGTVTLYRPSDARADRTMPTAPDADGVQSLRLENLTRGRWVIEVQWRSGDREYFAQESITAR